MKNNELLKSMPVSQPVSAELQGQFMDLVVEYMEESINWPDPDDQETFEKQLLEQLKNN